MPIPKRIARFNKIATNRVTSLFAGWMPGFAIVDHIGRKSGRQYRTPVNAFRDRGTLTIALTYGADSHWVQNVMASGQFDVHTRGRTLHLTGPRVVHDERRELVPIPVRLVLRLAGVADFLQATIEQERMD